MATERDIQFLLNTDFNGQENFSYNELLHFLRTLKGCYKDLYLNNIQLYQELNKERQTYLIYEQKMIENNQLVEDKNKEVSNYLNILTKKLTIRERLTGKINYFK